MQSVIESLTAELAVLQSMGALRLVEILAAVVCGSALGADRRVHGSVAGMRTCTLVCVGAVVYTQVGSVLVAEYGIGDPSRMAGQIVTGIGFLGAGAILRVGQGVSGLTSAAVIWFAGALGVLIGSSYPLTAVGLAFGVVVLLRGLEIVENRLVPRPEPPDRAPPGP